MVNPPFSVPWRKSTRCTTVRLMYLLFDLGKSNRSDRKKNIAETNHVPIFCGILYRAHVRILSPQRDLAPPFQNGHLDGNF
jgi:hypothetical protein